jgi:hypothetical protein
MIMRPIEQSVKSRIANSDSRYPILVSTYCARRLGVVDDKRAATWRMHFMAITYFHPWMDTKRSEFRKAREKES